MRAPCGVSDSDGAGMTPRGPLAIGRPVVSAHPKCELQLLRKELKRPSCFESLTTGPGRGWAASSAPGDGPRSGTGADSTGVPVAPLPRRGELAAPLLP